MNTKLAIEILLWQPTARPFNVLDYSVIRYFHQKAWPTKKIPACLNADCLETSAARSKRVMIFDKLRDQALNLIASRLDRAAEIA